MTTVHEDRLRSTTMPSPVGELTLVASSRGLRAVLWPGEHDLLDTPSRGRIRLGGPEHEAGDDAAAAGSDAAKQVLATAIAQLEEYFAGTRTEFDVPLDPVGTEFQRQAWTVLRSIPYGRTISYGEQAARLGDRNKSRAVGAANGKNPISIIVPCHRVVGADGTLTGFAAGLDAKAWLLQHEQGVAGQGRLALG